MSKISVIVPVYKVEPYLHRCVDSILNQTFSDFELILVDDGSPDNCPKICDEYAEKDNRIKVVHKLNGGLSSARNAGMKVAEGTYIMFCDSDDYVAPDWCERMYHQIRENPECLAVSNIYRVTGEKCKAAVEDRSDKNSISFFALYKMGLSCYVWNKIFERGILAASAIEFDENCRFAEDVEFIVRYYQQCKAVQFIGEPMYYYDQVEGSIMHSFKPELLGYHLPLFYVRLPLISEEDKPEYCDIWLYQLLHLFDNVFDPRCTWSLFKKLRYNQKMIKTKEFRYCLEHASGKNENPLTLKILRTYNYYLYWLFEKLVNIKHQLWR